MEGKETSTQEEEKEANMKEEELCKVAREGDCRKVKELVDSGADVTYFDSNGFTPLMHAAKQGHCEVVEYLLKSGAPWNALHPSGSCAGDFAMEAGHQDTFDLLLNAGLQAELVLGRIAIHDKSNCSADYLEQRVLYSEDRLMDEEGKGVMMAWENPLMEAHARAVCGGGEGGYILNVGFGMGLVDTAIQKYNPASHTIIEAHPDVYARMQATGWGDKHNVKIIFGRWQDVLPQLESYDGIFFDTYGEYYEDMKEFHQYLPKLLKGEGIYSFFNGLCADNAFFHVVYCQLVALELANIGYTTQFIPLPVKDCLEEKAWEGIKRKYWQLDTYYLPVCQASSE